MSKRAIVTGGKGGLGSLIVKQLEPYYNVQIWDLPHVDIANSASVARAVDKWDGFNRTNLDLLVNCAGINEPCWIGDGIIEQFDLHMGVNARGFLLLVYLLLQQLRGGTVCNIVSNASHVPMRASLAYNASKAAAAMMTRQMARELGTSHDITCFSVSPNKLAGTPMSQYTDRRIAELRGWSAEEARKNQLAALPTGEETPPEIVAEFIGWLLQTKQRHKYLQGCDIPYGG